MLLRMIWRRPGASLDVGDEERRALQAGSLAAEMLMRTEEFENILKTHQITCKILTETGILSY